MHCYCQLPLKVMLLLIKTWVQKVFREFNIKIIDEGEPFLYIFDKMIATSGITNNKNLFFFFFGKPTIYIVIFKSRHSRKTNDNNKLQQQLYLY